LLSSAIVFLSLDDRRSLLRPVHGQAADRSVYPPGGW
jgi:hypothetical protein